MLPPAGRPPPLATNAWTASTTAAASPAPPDCWIRRNPAARRASGGQSCCASGTSIPRARLPSLQCADCGEGPGDHGVVAIATRAANTLVAIWGSLDSGADPPCLRVRGYSALTSELPGGCSEVTGASASMRVARRSSAGRACWFGNAAEARRTRCVPAQGRSESASTRL
jgi:hypothetical protein